MHRGLGAGLGGLQGAHGELIVADRRGGLMAGGRQRRSERKQDHHHHDDDVHREAVFAAEVRCVHHCVSSWIEAGKFGWS